jgi:hypothetical protein
MLVDKLFRVEEVLLLLQTIPVFFELLWRKYFGRFLLELEMPELFKVQLEILKDDPGIVDLIYLFVVDLDFFVQKRYRFLVVLEDHSSLPIAVACLT